MNLSKTYRRPPKTSRADIFDSWAGGMAMPPDLTVSAWADKYRILPPESPIGGKWRTSTAPYQEEPMNIGADPDVDATVLMWSSQVGKSEALNNVIGKHVHVDPASMMMVQPTIKLAEDYADERISPMLRGVPEIASFMSNRTRDKTNQKGKKTFPGGYLVFSGANSPGSLASRPIKIMLLDEIDKFKANIGKDGDPFTQAIQRQENFWDTELYLTSTPTIAGKSAIEDWWHKSDQRYYLVPCPHCAEFQFLDFFPQRDRESKEEIGGVHWQEGKPETAEYCCKHCGAMWSQKQVRGSVKHGYWKASKPFNRIAGFHINSIYSFSPKTSMARLARQWEESKGEPLKEQTFYNLKLGLTYDPAKGSETTPDQLFERREDFGLYLPPQVLLITAGVDVQHDRLEIQWVGWGSGDEKWILDHVK
ncbi:MAG: phage terminase large subunit family protein, partial [Hyphomicrobiaceae bacterium]|nr:phage terminase large subunit family protein [Hyphomicrobiaceae bacterium]